MVPVIQVWMEQWNATLPVASNTRPSWPPVASVLVWQPPSTVALCDSKPALVNRMTWPTRARMASGLNEKSSILTAIAPAFVVSEQATAAADGDAGGVSDGALVGGAGVPDAATVALAGVDPSDDAAATAVGLGTPDPAEGAAVPDEQAATMSTAIDATAASRRDTRSSSERDLFLGRVRRCPVGRRRAMVGR